MASRQQRQSPKSKKGQGHLSVGRLTPVKDAKDDALMASADCNEDIVHFAISRSWRIAALGVATVTGLVALLGIGIGSHAATPATGVAAELRYSGEYKHHTPFSAMYDPSDPPCDVQGNINRIGKSFDAATNSPGTYVPVGDITLPFKDETLITQSDAGGAPIGSLPARSVTIGGITNHPPNMRAYITAPPEHLGWVTIADLNSFYNHLDKFPDPQGCPPANTPNNAEYIAVQGELPVTDGASARSRVVSSLKRNDVVYISEVRFVASEHKLRGRMSSGNGWVTIQNQKSCEDKMTALPPAPGRGLMMGPAPGGRKASFIVIGDWGWDPKIHWTVKNRQCQEHIALQMLQKFRELGDVQFVINVGDSFYPGGVWGAQDEQWQTKWRDVYHSELRDVPWYSVYGNHDMHADPCTCNPDTNTCAQVNLDPNDRSKFYMPSPNYFVEHPDISLEVVALDLNRAGDPAVCQFTPCPAQCQPIIESRLAEANNLFNQRIQQSQAKSLVIFSHYPSDYLKATQFLTGMMNDRRHNIAYFGGHRHSTDQTSVAPIPPHQSWLVGGGGGLGCDGPQGFVVGEINADNTIRTYSVMVPGGVCCT